MVESILCGYLLVRMFWLKTDILVLHDYKILLPS